MNKGTWNKTIAFFDLETIEGFTIKGFKLVEGANGKFIGFPSEKKDDEWMPTTWATDPLKIELLKLAKFVYENGVDKQPAHSLKSNEYPEEELNRLNQEQFIQSEPPHDIIDEELPF